ncbi:MAG TPA: hypothetical protein VFE27_08850 [Acidobacteriaceae bacterium]|nr:hypothetical protein [Acidobacteriaceae bacterium]
MPADLQRTYGAHHLHFITCSCYRRLPLLNSARPRARFLGILEQTRQRYRFVVVGYVAMPEHVRLLLTEPEVGTLDRDAGAEAAHGPGIVAQEKASRSATARIVYERGAAGVLAGALL